MLHGARVSIIDNVVFHFGLLTQASTLPIGQWAIQYKLLYTISNNIEVYEESVPRTKKGSHCVVIFEAGEQNRIL